MEVSGGGEREEEEAVAAEVDKLLELSETAMEVGVLEGFRKAISSRRGWSSMRQGPDSSVAMTRRRIEGPRWPCHRDSAFPTEGGTREM